MTKEYKNMVNCDLSGINPLLAAVWVARGYVDRGGSVTVIWGGTIEASVV